MLSFLIDALGERKEEQDERTNSFLSYSIDTETLKSHGIRETPSLIGAYEALAHQVHKDGIDHYHIIRNTI